MGTQFAVLRRSTEHQYGAPSSSPIQPICVSDDRRLAASSPPEPPAPRTHKIDEHLASSYAQIQMG
ncbi:hypothetical protein ACLOJK_039402 [Asimina triloba]